MMNALKVLTGKKFVKVILGVTTVGILSVPALTNGHELEAGQDEVVFVKDAPEKTAPKQASQSSVETIEAKEERGARPSESKDVKETEQNNETNEKEEEVNTPSPATQESSENNDSVNVSSEQEEVQPEVAESQATTPVKTSAPKQGNKQTTESAAEEKREQQEAQAKAEAQKAAEEQAAKEAAQKAAAEAEKERLAAEEAERQRLAKLKKPNSVFINGSKVSGYLSVNNVYKGVSPSALNVSQFEVSDSQGNSVKVSVQNVITFDKNTQTNIQNGQSVAAYLNGSLGTVLVVDNAVEGMPHISMLIQAY